jgi:glycosyltransferase involved in cell wall biosynthesis
MYLTEKNKKLIIFAPKLSAGGLILLNQLIRSLSQNSYSFKSCIVITTELSTTKSKRVITVLCSDRRQCEQEVLKNYSVDTVIFNFVNFPILRFLARRGINEIIFFHNILLCSSEFSVHNLKSFFKMCLFRFIALIIGKHRRFIVQSTSTKKKLSKIIPKDMIWVSKYYGRIIKKDKQQYRDKYDFVYISSDHKHKNNARLIDAWRRLDCRRLRLTLIIPGGERLKIKYENVPNLTIISDFVENEYILKTLRNVDYLIYPSITESFGLPLLEANIVKTPIIAARRDYVWEVCEPIDTFDPLDVTSIMSSVRRLTDSQYKNNFDDSKDLIELILQMSQKTVS